MKNNFAYIMLVMLLIGCTNNQPQNSTESPDLKIGSAIMDGTTEMTPIIAGETSNQEIWLKYIQAHNDKNLDIIAEINAEDWEGYTADGSVVKGNAAHIEILDNWFNNANANPKWEVKWMIANAAKNKEGIIEQWLTTGNEYTDVDENGDEIIPTDIEILRFVAAKFVKREMNFFEITKLEKPITKFDLQPIVFTLIRSTFPKYELPKEKLKSLMDALTSNPTAEPGLSIPVWNGKTMTEPGNTESLIFDNGQFTINLWQEPSYRKLTPRDNSLGVFEEFLTFIFKNPAEKEVFLDWLSWCLQNETDKPSWAIFLFSEKHGTGKSTLASVVKKLFGEENASEQQGIKPIISRFNKPILHKKLIYAEEVKVAQNSDDGNKLKTLISERQTMAESKGKDIEPVDHRCCFILTTNHKPIWLEPGDRRFYIIHVDHEGFAAGGAKYEEFVALVQRVKQTYDRPIDLASLYGALKERKQSAIFDPYSLNVNKVATDIMKEINALSPDIVEEMLEEFLREHGILFVPVRYANKVVEFFAHRNPNASKYSFDRLGWKKKKFAWGGKGPAWAFYDPQSNPEKGRLQTKNFVETIENHLNRTLGPALNEIGFGINFEMMERKAPKTQENDAPF